MTKTPPLKMAQWAGQIKGMIQGSKQGALLSYRKLATGFPKLGGTRVRVGRSAGDRKRRLVNSRAFECPPLGKSYAAMTY